MSSPVIELADLVCADLNTAALGFTAARGYLPVLKRESLASAIKVFVIPKGETGTATSRNAQNVDREIYVGVIKKLAKGSDDSFDNDEIDALMGDTMEAIKSRLSFRRQGGYAWSKTEHSPLYDADHLEKFRQFTSVVTVTYRATQQAP